MIQVLNANALHIPLADQSVQCVVTSPPYFGLRDYGTAKWEGGDPECDHRENDRRNNRPHGNNTTFHGGNDTPQTHPYRDVCGKCGAVRIDNQIGLEETPEQYIAAMVAVFREVWRVLRDDGTFWCNIGDSYLHNKQLAGIPWHLAFALQADGWVLRSDIIWAKPNPMPESVTDRPTKAHEYLFLLTKSQRYFYDGEAVREKFDKDWEARVRREAERGMTNLAPQFKMDDSRNDKGTGILNSQVGARHTLLENGGRNRRTVWKANPDVWKLRSDLSDGDRAYVLGELVRRGLLANNQDNNADHPQSSCRNQDIS